jgi:ribose transport system permease protein
MSSVPVASTADATTVPDGAAVPGRAQLRARGWQAQNLVLLGVIIALAAVFGSLNHGFLSAANIRTIGQTVAIVGVLSIVQTALIVCGVVDVSVGSMTGFCSVIAAMVFTSTQASALGILTALASGAALGLVNGLAVAFGRVNPIIATLGTLSAFQGLALVITNGQAKGYVLGDPVFVFVARGSLAGIPTMVWVLAVVALAVGFLLKRTDIGRNLYAIGGNDVAARLAGIKITKYLMGVYVLSGLVAGVAGILLTAYTGSGNPISGSAGLELQSITAAALGGAVLAGGKGGVGGTVLAVVLLGTLQNGLTVLGVNSFYQYIAQGTLLITAVVIQKRRSGERRVGRPT